MQVKFTVVETDTFTIGGSGQSIGQFIDERLRLIQQEGSTVAQAVSVEITEEDRVAMRLVHEAKHGGKPRVHPSVNRDLD